MFLFLFSLSPLCPGADDEDDFLKELTGGVDNAGTAPETKLQTLDDLRGSQGGVPQKNFDLESDYTSPPEDVPSDAYAVALHAWYFFGSQLEFFDNAGLKLTKDLLAQDAPMTAQWVAVRMESVLEFVAQLKIAQYYAQAGNEEKANFYLESTSDSQLIYSSTYRRDQIVCERIRTLLDLNRVEEAQELLAEHEFDPTVTLKGLAESSILFHQLRRIEESPDPAVLTALTIEDAYELGQIYISEGRTDDGLAVLSMTVDRAGEEGQFDLAARILPVLVQHGADEKARDTATRLHRIAMTTLPLVFGASEQRARIFRALKDNEMPKEDLEKILELQISAIPDVDKTERHKAQAAAAEMAFLLDQPDTAQKWVEAAMETADTQPNHRMRADAIHSVALYYHRTRQEIPEDLRERILAIFADIKENPY